MYFITELTPDDFRLDSDGAASASVPLGVTRCKVSARCASRDRDSAYVWQQIADLEVNDRASAIKSLAYFSRVAQHGPPLTQHLDKKQVHEVHEFDSPVSGKKEKIWRYRRGDIRILFYYGNDRVLLLTDVVVKRSDKFEPAVLSRAAQAVNEYLSAIAARQVVVVK